MKKTIDDVIEFWNNNPLFSGESSFDLGTKEFFEDHKKTYYEDCFAGNFNDKLLIPENLDGFKVLDLGCGIGFWSVEILTRRKCHAMYCSDITQTAIELTKKRLDIYNLKADISIQNAERTSYMSNFFNHINCQGVIHHTPDTFAAIKEIARILKPDGTAYISVYYKNIFIRNWKYISFLGKLINKLGGGLKGRGRESIFKETDTNEITRLYDGGDNPIGKSYTKNEIFKMVEPFFYINYSFKFFFPARALPFKMPKVFQRFLAKKFGFMIFLQLIKK